jgi:4'-phosphopantetheinyl transferase EntD
LNGKTFKNSIFEVLFKKLPAEMGMIIQRDFAEGCQLGIWLIRENYDELFSKVSLNEKEMNTLDNFRNHSRKIEWLSVRTLANEMAGRSVRLIYNAERKPFLEDNSYNISISHSHEFTSILLSKDRKVGIDLEYMSHRISGIADRFMNKSEKVTDDPAMIQYHLYIYWCAKEALYKINDKRDIHFKKDIIIDNFDPEEKGELTGTVKTGKGKERFTLNYFRLNNYTIVWSCK